MNYSIKKKLIAASIAGSMLFGLGFGAAHAYAEQGTQSVMRGDASISPISISLIVTRFGIIMRAVE